MANTSKDTRQPFTVLLPDGPRKPMEIHDNEYGLVMALVDKTSVQTLSDDWNSVGVYILFSYPDAEGGYRVYVGKSPMGLRSRLMEHARSREWERALLIRRVTLYGLNSSQAGWLEGDLYDLFSTAQKARVENQVTPRDDTVAPYELRLLRSLRDPIVRVVRMLGYETESAPEPTVVAVPPPAIPTVDVRTRRKPRTAYNVSINDLLTVGLLYGGDKLTSTSNAWPASATLNAEGTITWNQDVYPSPSAAASAVCEGTPVNGWDFWAVDRGGDSIRLSTLRKRHLDAPSVEAGIPPFTPPAAHLLAPRHVRITSPTRKPKTQLGVSLQSLIDAGLLTVGTRLTSNDPSAPAEANVAPGGLIVWNGNTYTSPSTPAQAIKGNRNTNGWAFWTAHTDRGPIKLDDLRRQHLGIERPAAQDTERASFSVTVAELLAAEYVAAGDLLVSTRPRYPAVAYIDEDGTISYGGQQYPTPSAAGMAVRGGRATNGWDFWALEQGGKVARLSDVRLNYLTETGQAEGAEDEQ